MWTARTLAVALAFVAMTTSVAATATTSSYHDYTGIKPELTFCNVPINDMYITAYTNVGTDLQCGDCVRITNTGTGAAVVVKVVDKGGAIFDMSSVAFDAIDTDKQGYARGHLDIDYVKVPCSSCRLVEKPADDTPALRN